MIPLICDIYDTDVCNVSPSKYLIGMGRMRVNSASSQVSRSQLSPVISYIAYYFTRYFHKGYQYEVCFIYINVQQKFEGIMFGSIYINDLSILFHSTGLAS